MLILWLALREKHYSLFNPQPINKKDKNVPFQKKKRQEGTAQKIFGLGLLGINFILNSKIKHHCSVKIKGPRNFF